MTYSIMFVIVIILILNFFLLYTGPRCSSIQSVNSSISVREGERRIIGLNADTDSLKFGTVSPQTVARRSVYITNDRDASVTVFMEGDFAPWVNITPQEFRLKSGQNQEVQFAVRVPDYPENGDYTGNVIFCFK
ncbi:MAG: hypothetical protein Q8R37_01140 [Nanoarchaeota archaeon]|nr:hypothetical protein [Nanoarchaeota archaeon]